MTDRRAGRQVGPLNKFRDQPGKTFFLGIGINAYQHWPQLRNAVRDVQAVARLLQNDYGVAASNTVLLLDAQASRKGIIAALEDLADQIHDPDNLIIYYAGHGHLNHHERGFWVPEDAPQDGIDQYIRNSTLREYIGDIPSRHTLLISDACFSGSLFVRGQRSSALEPHELMQLPSRWAICSGRHDETVADGPTDGHSPFAQSFLDVLGKTTRPYLTSTFLYEQVRDQTRANYQQLPDGGPLGGVGHKRGEYVFQRVAPTTDTSTLIPVEAQQEIATSQSFPT